MKRIREWAIVLSFTFIVTAFVAFFNGFFVDATILALYATSAIFFLLSPQRTKDYRWNSFKLISYLLFICGFAVSMFKYIFLEAIPI